MQSAKEVTSITATLLDEKEIAEVVASAEMPDFSADEMATLHALYERDFDLPPESHACDLKSSARAESGKTRSEYVAPPVLIA